MIAIISPSILVGLVAAALLLVRVLRIGMRPKGYAPGPPTFPIIGNLHQIPSRDLHIQFEKWAKEYGPVFSVMTGTQTMIVLSSDVAVKELLDKRSAIYSDRPYSYVAADLCSGGRHFLFLNYGPLWRGVRKMAHNVLNVKACEKYIPSQDLEIKQTMSELVDTPADFVKHFRRYAVSLTTSLILGFRCPTFEDQKVQELFHQLDEFTVLAMSPMTALMDFYPILRYLPDAINPVARKSKALFKATTSLYLSHWMSFKQQNPGDKAPFTFCKDQMETQQREGFSDEQAAWNAGSMLQAGSDTTSSSLVAFVQALAVFPEVQRKAQEEIDRVIGKDRLPLMEDERNLPYLWSCRKELLRWMPAGILGALPHSCTKDDEYMGYTIPKGASVVNNVWAINMDEKRFPNPREFRPERYFGDTTTFAESAALPDATRRDHYSFGAGRRICQGMHLAERSLFLGMSRLVWAFNVQKAKGPDGKDIDIDVDRFTQGIVCIPDTFRCDIRPRDSARAEMLHSAWGEAKATLRLDNVT